MITSSRNKHIPILIVLAILINGMFFYLHNPHVFFAITQAHGQVGYNLCKYNSFDINPTLTAHIEAAMRSEQKLIDYDCIEDIDFGAPNQSFPINDTIGYGVLLGIIWKVTGSFKFVDVQLLQMLIFVLLVPIYYALAYMLFSNISVACMCSIAQLLFFPLIAYNVMPVRDIWAYYGLLVLAYAVCAQLYGSISIFSLMMCALFFSLSLWMRPILFFALIMLTLYVCIMRCMRLSKKSVLPMLALMWGISITLFWLPYMRFNVKRYNRFVVSPAGQSLLEGLGEIENPWGHKLNDEYVAEFIGKKHGLAYGTPEFDEAAMQEFKTCMCAHPCHYAKTLLFRLPDLFVPGLQWIFYAESPYAHCKSLYEKLTYACGTFGRLSILLLRHLYMRLYIVLAWIGIFLLWRHKQYKAFWLILCCLVAGVTTFPSHIEYRYQVPYYWVMSLAVGYIFYFIWGKLRSVEKNINI